jgi:hypothetical protein
MLLSRMKRIHECLSAFERNLRETERGKRKEKKEKARGIERKRETERRR